MYSSGSLEYDFELSLAYNVRSWAPIDFVRLGNLRGIYVANQLELITPDPSKRFKPPKRSTPSLAEKKKKFLREYFKKPLLREENEGEKVLNGYEYFFNEEGQLTFQQLQLPTFQQQTNPARGERREGQIKTKISFDIG